MNISPTSLGTRSPSKRESISLYGPSSPSRPSLLHSQSQKILNGYNDSVSSLQHSVLKCKFPKAERFPTPKPANDPESRLELPSTFSQRTTTLGYGNKIVMSEINSKSGSDTPAPNSYTPKNWVLGENKGKSFGLSHEFYRKVYNPAADILLPEVAKNNPGPGTYYRPLDPIKRDRNFTMRLRGKMFNELEISDTPFANKYNPNFSLVTPARHQNRTMGLGGRSDFTKEGSLSPGPGAYKISSKFDTYAEKNLIKEKVREKLMAIKLKAVQKPVEQ